MCSNSLSPKKVLSFLFTSFEFSFWIWKKETEAGLLLGDDRFVTAVSGVYLTFGFAGENQLLVVQIINFELKIFTLKIFTKQKRCTLAFLISGFCQYFPVKSVFSILRVLEQWSSKSHRQVQSLRVWGGLRRLVPSWFLRRLQRRHRHLRPQLRTRNSFIILEAPLPYHNPALPYQLPLNLES